MKHSPALILVADRKVLNGAFPASVEPSNPVALASFNAASVQVTLLQSLMSSGLEVSFLGSNSIDGTYVAAGGGSITLTTIGQVSVLHLGVTPWGFLKVQFSAASGTLVYSAQVYLSTR